MAVQVSVIGSGAHHAADAEEVGRLLAEYGCTVVTGGLGEVMAAAARGAKSAGGTTIAVLPGESRSAANEWSDHVVVTGIGHARNLAVAASGDAVIAVGGAWGTLAEIAFARLLGRPVVILGPGPAVDGVPRAASAADAVELALGFLSRRERVREQPMETIVTHVRIRAGKEDAWDEAFRERISAARGQPGFVAAQLCMPQGKSNERIVIGTWRSRDDWEAWHDTPEFRRTRHELEEADPERESEWWHEVLLEERV